MLPNMAGRSKCCARQLPRQFGGVDLHNLCPGPYKGVAMAPYVGRPLKRFEDPRLVTGQGSFVDDLQLPGMLHAVVLRSPHAHARILSLDVAPVRALPGVAAVLTTSDIAGAVRD